MQEGAREMAFCAYRCTHARTHNCSCTHGTLVRTDALLHTASHVHWVVVGAVAIVVEGPSTVTAVLECKKPRPSECDDVIRRAHVSRSRGLQRTASRGR